MYLNSCPKLGSSSSSSCSIPTSVNGNAILPVASDKNLKISCVLFFSHVQSVRNSYWFTIVYNPTTSVHFCCHQSGLGHYFLSLGSLQKFLNSVPNFCSCPQYFLLFTRVILSKYKTDYVSLVFKPLALCLMV